MVGIVLSFVGWGWVGCTLTGLIGCVGWGIHGFDCEVACWMDCIKLLISFHGGLVSGLVIE